jgi:hypothetical protein
MPFFARLSDASAAVACVVMIAARLPVGIFNQSPLHGSVEQVGGVLTSITPLCLKSRLVCGVGTAKIRMDEPRALLYVRPHSESKQVSGR